VSENNESIIIAITVLEHSYFLIQTEIDIMKEEDLK
jgi:hypothetical protein